MSTDALRQLQNANARRTTAFGGTTQNKSRADVDHNTKGGALLRFCDICRAYNIDPMCPVSLHLIWILSSKCQRKGDLMQKFVDATSHNNEVVGIDWEAAHVIKTPDTSDWLVLLQYTSVVAAPPDAPPPGVVVRRLSECWHKSRLSEEYDATPQLLQHMLMYVMIEDVSAQKMLESKMGMIRCEEDRPVCRDLELRCLRCIASFNNDLIDDDVVIYDTLLSLLSLQVHPEMHVHVVAALKQQQTRTEAHETETRNAFGRLQLRSLARQLHQSKQWVYSATFDAWATKQQFSVTTTRRQQLLLYFLLAQPKRADPQKLLRLFSPMMLKRMDSQSLDQIDAHAIISVLQSIRVYSNNVLALVDFRTQCLAGISHSVRKTLSMAQILQLYVACYQHQSVQEKCWRGVMPVWNFTIRDSCERFARQHEYELDAVLDSILRCMLDHEFEDTSIQAADTSDS